VDFDWAWRGSYFWVGASNFCLELPPTFTFAGQLKELGYIYWFGLHMTISGGYPWASHTVFWNFGPFLGFRAVFFNLGSAEPRGSAKIFWGSANFPLISTKWSFFSYFDQFLRFFTTLKTYLLFFFYFSIAKDLWSSSCMIW